MPNTYRIAKKANGDLDNIWLYTVEKWSEEQANRYLSLLTNEFENIAANFEKVNQSSILNMVIDAGNLNLTT